MLVHNAHWEASDVLYETTLDAEEDSSYCRGCLGSVISAVRSVYNYIFTPNENPTWSGALFKTSIGLFGLVTVDQVVSKVNYNLLLKKKKYLEGVMYGGAVNTGIDIDVVDPRSNYPSVGLIITGVREACSLLHPKVLPQRSKIKNIKNEKTEGSDRLIKLSKLLLYFGISIGYLYKYDNAKFLAAVVHFASLVINFYEIKKVNKIDFLSSCPLIEIVHTYVLSVFISKMGRLNPVAMAYCNCLLERKLAEKCGHLLPHGMDSEQFMYNSMKESRLHLSVFNRYLNVVEISYPDLLFSYAKEYIKFYAQFKVATNALSLIGKNISSYMYVNHKLADIESDLIIDQKVVKQKNRYAARKLEQKRDEPPSDSAHGRGFQSYQSRYREPQDPIAEKTPKKKTKGVPDAQKVLAGGASPTSSSQDSVDLEPAAKRTTRENALQRISELGTRRTVAAVDMTKELKAAADFINGTIAGVGGSEFSLSWTMDKSRFAMKYEVPHERDRTNFAGNKLDRALNVLKVCYLVGLSEKRATEYIEKYNFYKLYRLKKFISYIFLQRRNDT